MVESGCFVHREWLVNCLKGIYLIADRKNTEKHFKLMVLIGEYNRANPDAPITDKDIDIDNPWYDPTMGKFI